jgi:hypothetical protein
MSAPNQYPMNSGEAGDQSDHRTSLGQLLWCPTDQLQPHSVLLRHQFAPSAEETSRLVGKVSARTRFVSIGPGSGVRAMRMSSLAFDDDTLMTRWKDGIITYLREAHKMGVPKSKLTPSNLAILLTAQHERRWRVHISRCVSKEHFLRYAARYVRRPPWPNIDY